VRQIVHDIRNHLAVAVANVEGFRDGVIEPTPQRLEAVLDSLARVESMLASIPWPSPDGSEPTGAGKGSS
jgi:hypothetical protein